MKKSKIIVSDILIAILIFCSIGHYLCYPRIQQTLIDNTSSSTLTYYALERTRYYDCIIDLKMKEDNQEDTELHQYLSMSGYEDGQLFQERLSQFQESLDEYRYDLNHEKDIVFYAYNTQTKQTYTNTSDALDHINTNKDLQNKYQWYYQVQYDQNGNPTIPFLSDEELKNDILDNCKEQVREYESDQYDEQTDTFETTQLTYKNPQNLIITYAVYKNLNPSGPLYMNVMFSYHDIFLYNFPYLCFFAIIVLLTTLLIPIRYLNENKLLYHISKIKFAILATLWICVFTSMSYLSSYLIFFTNNNLFKSILDTFGIAQMTPYLTPIINLLFWFIYYALFVILFFMIKYLFNKGIIKYLKENTVIAWLYYHCLDIINYIIHFDFNDNTNKTVLKIVLFNFAIMTVISLFFVYGTLFALIYSIIIFIILKKKFEEIQEDYQSLLKATKELSNGHFDTEINEDIGIFNPLKEEFSHIKDGFEKAVNEEVKSQRMKTELISNVSHDLKTPLTSIITYVDLLQNDQVSETEQKKYLNILERNALRLKNLIDDLFEVSKANSGDIQLDYVDIDIVSLIKQAQLECLDKLEEKHLDMRFSGFNEKVICHLDSSKTYRIFENLFMNISKYALAYTRVYIDMKDDGENISIVFKNISENEMLFNENEIVERFVQGDKSRNTGGSGLGLAIVKSFTEIQGGTFKVELDGDLFKTIIQFKKVSL